MVAGSCGGLLVLAITLLMGQSEKPVDLHISPHEAVFFDSIYTTRIKVIDNPAASESFTEIAPGRILARSEDGKKHAMMLAEDGGAAVLAAANDVATEMRAVGTLASVHVGKPNEPRVVLSAQHGGPAIAGLWNEIDERAVWLLGVEANGKEHHVVPTP